MNPRKAFATACIVSVLGAQAWIIFPAGSKSRERHWPFLNYPMYSPSHHAGDAIVLRKLRAVPCDKPDSALDITAPTLHVELGRYWEILHRLDRRRDPSALVDTVARLARPALGTESCTLELWQRAFVIGERGMTREDPPWVKSRAWRVGPDAGRRTSAPPARP